MRRRAAVSAALAWTGLLPLAVLTFLFMLPIVWMTTTSFQAGEKMFQLTTEWIPSVWHPENYPNALSRSAFPRFFLNSAIVSASVMLGNLIFCTLAGYGLAKYRFRGDRLLLLVILSTLMLPLIDAFGVFLMRQFMLKIPSDYVEAARIDGAGELRILWSIIIPQCRAALAVLALFSFRDSWDQFLWPLVVVSRDEFRTYPLGLVRFGDDYGNPPTEQMAIAVLATIPIFLLFLLLQRALRKGFDLSALKG